MSEPLAKFRGILTGVPVELEFRRFWQQREGS